MNRPTGRVLMLLELLQSGGVRTVAELADRLGVDGRTVRRYVGQLIDLDLPVESVRGRYGGYRLAPGYRLPPLMLDDDEALAVLLGLIAGSRSGLTTPMGTASETAAAKIRRVLPSRLARRLESVLDALSFTSGPGRIAAPDPEVLLTVADAVSHRRPVSVRYTDREGRVSDRTLHPYGVVSHGERWYVRALDARSGEERSFRLDRITGARAQPGSFEPPEGIDPAQRVVAGLATAPYRHEVTVWIRGTVERIRTRLPESIATIERTPGGPAGPGGQSAEPETELETEPETADWLRVELRVEQLDWLPPLLAALDLPFEIERPDELRERVLALADRLAASARRTGQRHHSPNPTV
ncbi:YafY family transcriptional regulator [Actinospica durhamensis]|uniref:YafY family transcriptional regulator n=1 Tax=Actinospica durhamensis TaxID=1508375 RepID=A0A941EJE0_9ACTN|nr:YafY family protein [Actinospica durhamensis]MBR7831850.1 YafY family transcriptional regulator [Actinospica durhamensis]